MDLGPLQSRFVSVDPVPDGWERSMRAEVEENRLTNTPIERVGEAWFAFTRCGAVLCVHKAPEVEPCGQRLRGPYSDFDWLTPPWRAAATGPRHPRRRLELHHQPPEPPGEGHARQCKQNR